MDATFLLSNIVPQDLHNNANFWYRLEAYCRSLTKRYSSVYIVSGPLYLPEDHDGKKIVSYEVLYSLCFTLLFEFWYVRLAEVSFLSSSGLTSTGKEISAVGQNSLCRASVLSKGVDGGWIKVHHEFRSMA